MTKLTLRNCAQDNITVLENEFIDHYMLKANGEYVKVYLLVLRHLGESSGKLSISEMADVLECTEKDVLRALKYWKKQGILDYSEAYSESSREDSRDSIPKEAPSPQRETMRRPSRDDKDFKELLFVAEQYLGKTLSATDVDTITYFFDSLEMSADLIEYLIEYCVENGHKSIRYIQKVALSWFDDGVRTVAEARQRSVNYNKNCYAVMNAFGLKNRAPGEAELAYIKKWSEEFGFTLDIILEACNRTISATHQPSFEYTDSILQKWRSRQVRKIQDIAALDAAFQKERSRSAAVSRVKPAARNLNNFDRRSYDMDSLEERLLNSN